MDAIPYDPSSRSKHRSKDGGTRSRSSTGCLTCRRRRKKCDETAYPVCRNCQDRSLECGWPLKVQEMHKQLEKVRYYGDEYQGHQGQYEKGKDPTRESKIGNGLERATGRSFESTLTSNSVHYDEFSDAISTLSDFSDILPYAVRLPPVYSYNTSSSLDTEKLRSEAGRGKSSFLKRIALQEDCVEEREG